MEENDDLCDLPDTTQAVCHKCGAEALYSLSGDSVRCFACGASIDTAALKRELEACFEQFSGVLESDDDDAIAMLEETIGEVFDAVKNGRTVEDGFYEKQMARLAALIARREASLN